MLLREFYNGLFLQGVGLTVMEIASLFPPLVPQGKTCYTDVGFVPEYGTKGRSFLKNLFDSAVVL